MPTVTALFENFNNSIKVPTSILAVADSRLDRVKKALDNYYYGYEQKNTRLFVGSIGRQTDIHTSDIDVIYKVPYSTYTRYNAYQTNGQQAMLQDFRSVILRTYPTTYIKADGLVAVVAFDDGIVFEIMPGVVNADYSFTYPISNQGGYWGKTNPVPEIAAMDIRHRETSGNARKLARMVRAWKEYNNVPIGGLLIDTYVHKFLADYENKSKSYLYYDWITRDFFKFLSKQNDQASYVYALGSNQHVYLKGKFAKAAETAYNNAIAAIDSHTAGYYYAAVNNWKLIYGNKFKMVE